MWRRLLLVGALCLGGCVGDEFIGGDVDGGVNKVDQSPFQTTDWGNTGPDRPTCPGKESVISGTVYAPNGADPVPGATVFVPSQTPEMFPPKVKCEACGSLGTAYNYWTTVSKWDGTFSLSGVCPGQRTLVLQNGRFRRIITVQVPVNKTLKLPADRTRLPQVQGEMNQPGNSIPRIAVATGDYDKMECVLLKMGLRQGTFDLYEGAKMLTSKPARPTFASLVKDLQKMKSYNIIFINCTNNTFEGELANSQVIKNLSDYVSAGGRLYVTDWSYDWLEQLAVLSPFVDFEPGASGATPEPRNKAAIGAYGLKVQSDIKDTKLASWLGLFSGAIQNGKTLVEHFLAEWVMIHGVSKDVKVWVEGVVRNESGSIQGRRPLTVTFNYKNCGKVLFSSYHTEGRDDELNNYPYLPPKQFPQYCGAKMSPQDRILEYLIFDIANCIKPIE